MGWFMPRRSRSLAGSHGRRFPRRGGGGPSLVPARAVLLLLAMVAALAPRAFAQTTPDPGDRWTPGGIWNHDVTTTSLIGKLMLQQSVTIDRLAGTQTWANAAIDACPWTKVTPPLPSSPSCTTFKGYETSSSSFRNHPLTVANFVPTQAMIDNGGVVIRLRWKNYNSPAGDNVAMTEWVPLVPPPSAALVLTPASISEAGGVSTVTATLDRTTSAATTITVSAAAGAGAVAADFGLSSATTLTIASGSTTSAGTVTITANDNSAVSGSKQVTVSATAAGDVVEDPSDVTLTITDDEAPQTTLLLSPSSISENAGVSTVTATLDRTSSAATTITVSAAAGAGAVAADFGLSSATTLTIASGSTTSAGTVTITANDNDTDSPDKQVTVTATAANSQGAGTVSGATLTLTDDDDAPNAALSLNPASVSENGGASTVTATLTHPSSEPTTVTVTPVADAYSVAPGSGATIVVAAGSTTSADTVTITAVDNDVDAAEDKTVTVTGTAANSQGAGTVTGASLTIRDDEKGLAFARAEDPDFDRSRVLEVTAGSSASYTVALTSEPTGDVAVAVAAGNTFLSVSPTSLTFTATSWNTAQTVTVTAAAGDGLADPVAPLSHRARDGGYDGVTGALSVAVAAGTRIAVPAGTTTQIENIYVVNGQRVTVVALGVPAGVEIDLPSDLAEAVSMTFKPVGDEVPRESGFFSLAHGDERAMVDMNVVPMPAGGVKLCLAPPEGMRDAAGRVSGRGVKLLRYTDGSWTAVTNSDSDWDESRSRVCATVTATSPFAAGYANDGTRIAVPAGTTTQIENIYVVNGQRVTVVALGVPAGVEIDLPSDLAEAVSMTFKPVGDEVPRESGFFSLAHGDERAMVDMNVVPMPAGGVKLCLAPPEGMRDAAGRVSGRGVKLLRYTDGSWTAVTNSDSDWDESRSRVCATVEKTSPFAAGYANTKPKFDTPQKDLVFTVDEAIDPVVTLPAATGGDGHVTYSIKERLPDRLNFDSEKQTISGTPKAAQGKTGYTLVATDADNETTPWKFTIEVKPALAEARARLKRINESVLPELSRALWGSTLDAVTGRLESPDAAAPTAADGLEAAAGFVRANESALEEGDVSWKELLGAESFAFGLAGDGEGGAGIGGAVAWGSGDWQTRSRYEDELDWSGGAFSAHAGVDAALRPDLRAGLAASWFSSDVDYTDRSGDAAVTGSHESRMMSLTPYLGWDVGDGTRLWGAAGYGWGKIEIVDADLRERFGAQKADSRFLAGAAGGSVPVWSRGPATLEAKGSAEATRWRVKDNDYAIAGVVVSTRRLRLAAVGSRAYALDGGATLTPSLELGGRWDGGDGATGAGLEGGAGLSWTDPARGLTVEAKGRALLAHNSNVEEEWGASGSMRLETDADGLGLSFGLRPSWGASGSGLARLWDEGVAARPAVGGGNEARLETELGYGLPAFGGAGVTTPYAGFGLAQGGERDLRAGVRLGLDAGFDLGIEAERRENAADTGHGIGLDLSIRW